MASRELVSRDSRRLALSASEVAYVLVRRRGRRGVGLKVDETGLTVSAPATMSLGRIEALVRESERWILRKIAEWSARQVPPVEWRDGAVLPYAGESIVLRVRPGARPHAELRDGELRISVRGDGGDEEVRRAVVRWYKRRAADLLHARTLSLAAAAGILSAPKVMVSSAMARWGSCNSRREVRLAWRLVKARLDLVDYVICHELAHLRHMDHSRAFWAEVARQCPEYARLRAELFATDHLYRSF
jgi:predicted metal-dependent hydrolase